jgi:RNA polymerase sigma factor (TIGR02999 family)
LQATALVHEAFLKLVNVDRWDSKRHFFAAAADAMRKILVDQARRKSALKRGAGYQRRELDFCAITAPEKPQELLAIDAALTELAKTNAKASQIVILRFFVGLPIHEAAELMGLSPRSANRLWASARSWLAVELGINQ